MNDAPAVKDSPPRGSAEWYSMVDAGNAVCARCGSTFVSVAKWCTVDTEEVLEVLGNLSTNKEPGPFTYCPDCPEALAFNAPFVSIDEWEENNRHQKG